MLGTIVFLSEYGLMFFLSISCIIIVAFKDTGWRLLVLVVGLEYAWL